MDDYLYGKGSVKKYDKSVSQSAGRLRCCLFCKKRMRRKVISFNYAFCSRRCEIKYAIELKRTHKEKVCLSYKKSGSDDFELPDKEKEKLKSMRKYKKEKEKFRHEWYRTLYH